MFVNLELHSLNDIIFSKIIKHVIVKAKQTYIERLFFNLTLYLWVNRSCYEGTPRRCCSITLDETALWVDVCASSAYYWSVPNDS
jgi:hypothetical protein